MKMEKQRKNNLRVIQEGGKKDDTREECAKRDSLVRESLTQETDVNELSQWRLYSCRDFAPSKKTLSA